MQRGHGCQVSAWLLLMTAAWAPLAGCGGRAGSNDRGGGAQGGETSRGGGSPQGGGATDEPPPPVDPEVSRAWTWEHCGTLQPEAIDRAALFDADGRIVVLGASGVRVYDAAGARADLASAVPADFLVTASDGSVLSGRSTDAGVALTPLGASDPSIVLPSAPAGVCGSRFAMSADGAYLLATGEDLGCAWRVSDSSFVGSVAAEQVTVRDSRFVTVELGVMSRDVVQRDFAGRELSRRQLGDGPIILSPAGDRAVTKIDMIDRALVDLDSGDVVPWDMPPATATPLPVFSPRGEMVLVGDGIFSTADGVRRFSLDPQGRLAGRGARELTLASDGSRAVSSGFGRATLFDVEAKGVRAVLGPPVLPDPLRESRGASDLAVSRDGTLLVYNMELSGAFGIQPAPSFSDSHVIWDMQVELNLSVDVSTDGRLAAIGGDGRAIYDGRDGHVVWAAVPPPAEVVTGEICLLDRLRFSPKATWLAGSDYSHDLQVFALNSAEPWQPLLELPGTCDSAVFSRDERLMATAAAALYRTGVSSSDWTQVWASPLPAEPTFDYAVSDVTFSPDEAQLLVSRCPQRAGRCVTTLLNVDTGAVDRQLTELQGPNPSFSPEGSWIVAANKLLHLPSGDVRPLGEQDGATNVALFMPDGDIVAGSSNGALTRYCRNE